MIRHGFVLVVLELTWKLGSLLLDWSLLFGNNTLFISHVSPEEAGVHRLRSIVFEISLIDLKCRVALEFLNLNCRAFRLILAILRLYTLAYAQRRFFV